MAAPAVDPLARDIITAARPDSQAGDFPTARVALVIAAHLRAKGWVNPPAGKVTMFDRRNAVDVSSVTS